MEKLNVNKHIKKASSYTVAGALGLVVMGFLLGCEHKEQAEQSSIPADIKEQGYFIVIEEVGVDKYKVVEQYQTPGATRAILKKMDGSEELLSEERLKELSAAEAKKVEEGTSKLTQPDDSSVSSGGMSLGETILASAAGAIIGSWLGNKLFNNPNYQQRANNTPSTMSPKSPAKPTASNAATSSDRKTGFMQKSSSSSANTGFSG
ncbi:MAG: hypothetical protein QG567_1590 [Campylobacterota bacterium]|nr:hypothetical protein [Campylobacterota bacterium]